MGTSQQPRTSSLGSRLGSLAAVLVATLLALLSVVPAAKAEWEANRVAVCGDGSVHFGDPTYRVLAAGRSEWEEVDPDPSHSLQAGSDGRIYGRDGTKRDCAGLLLGQATTRDLLSSPALRVVVDENGKFLYFSQNGSVDSQNVLHLVENRSGSFRYRQITPDDRVALDVALNSSITIRTGQGSQGYQVEVDSQDQAAIFWHVDDSADRGIYYAKLNRSGGMDTNATKVAQTGSTIYLNCITTLIGPTDKVYLAYTTSERLLFFVRVAGNGTVEVPATRLMDDYAPKCGWDMDNDSQADLYLMLDWLNPADPMATGGEYYYLKLNSDGEVLVGPSRLRPPVRPPSPDWIGLTLVASGLVFLVLFTLLVRRWTSARPSGTLQRERGGLRPPKSPPPPTR